MALLFLDSFDHYSASQLLRKWTATAFGGVGTIVAGRTNNGYQCGATNNPYRTLGAEYATLTAGIAYRTQAFANTILEFKNAINDPQMYLEHVGDGRLRFKFMFSNASPPSTFVMNLNEWYFFEMQATIVAATPGHVTATARVNGTEILSWDFTAPSGTAGNFASVGFGAPGGGSTCTVDDFYCTDTEYLGDIKVGVLYPNAAGDLSAWTPNGAGANYTKVMEHPADDDTTYNAAASVGLTDLYNLDNIDPAFTGTIKGAQALWLVKKSDAGAGSIKGQWKSSGTTVEGTEYFPSAANYLYDIQAARKSLFTAADWTQTEIDALQIGVKRTA